MTATVETYRGFVYPWAIDHVGHMNVQSYTARFDEASWHFLAHLGVSPRSAKRIQRCFVALDQRTQHKREVLEGTLLHVRTELLEMQGRKIRFVHRMFDSETKEEVSSMEILAIYFDTLARKSAELPAETGARAKELLAMRHAA